MIVTQYLEQEQESRRLSALNAVEVEADRKADLYAYGEFDAKIEAEANPKWAENRSYRQGYQESFWHFYDKKYGIKLATEF